MEQPKKRSKLRSRLGNAYYGGLRRLLWLKLEPSFAKTRQAQPLSCLQFRHATPLGRLYPGSVSAPWWLHLHHCHWYCAYRRRK